MDTWAVAMTEVRMIGKVGLGLIKLVKWLNLAF